MCFPSSPQSANNFQDIPTKFHKWRKACDKLKFTLRMITLVNLSIKFYFDFPLTIEKNEILFYNDKRSENTNKEIKATWHHSKKMKWISSTYTHASFTKTCKLHLHKYGANKWEVHCVMSMQLCYFNLHIITCYLYVQTNMKKLWIQEI